MVEIIYGILFNVSTPRSGKLEFVTVIRIDMYLLTSQFNVYLWKVCFAHLPLEKLEVTFNDTLQLRNFQLKTSKCVAM